MANRHVAMLKCYTGRFYDGIVTLIKGFWCQICEPFQKAKRSQDNTQLPSLLN